MSTASNSPTSNSTSSGQSGGRAGRKPRDEGRSVPHATQACDTCRRRKVRCEGNSNAGTPCPNCVKAEIECTWFGSDGRRNGGGQNAAQQLGPGGYAQVYTAQGQMPMTLNTQGYNSDGSSSGGSQSPYSPAAGQPMMPQMGYPAGYGAQAGGQAQYGPGGPQAPMGQAQWQQQQTYQGNPAGGVGRGFAPVQGGYTQQPLQFPQQGGGRGAHPGQPGQPGYPFQNTHFPGPPYFPGEGGNGANHYNGNH